MENILLIIKKQIGLELALCDHFVGVREHGGRRYFNVLLNERVSESNEFVLLERFSIKYNLISVEPNGLSRVAIYF